MSMRAAELVAGKMGAAAQEEKGVLAEAAVGLARRGLQLTSSSRGGEDSTAAEAAVVENVARRVARAVGAEIPAAEDDPAAGGAAVVEGGRAVGAVGGLPGRGVCAGGRQGGHATPYPGN